MKKFLALLAVLALTLSMMSIASAEPIKSTYNLSEVSFIDAVGWYWTRDLSLVLRDDTHYELFYREYAFGTTDPGLKANKLIVYSGTYSSAESADDEACHFDITLDTLDGIYFEQHGKGFGRNVLGYAMVLDTDNWTDEMTDIAFPDGSDDGAADFLANHDIAGTVITVEDLREDLDDVTLENKIVACSNVEESIDVFNITE
ncbi:MAG: hypothetical protein IJI53_13635 [Clostridia bacterium]|nr:hypothetical protein [Clostridia bacterium]